MANRSLNSNFATKILKNKKSHSSSCSICHTFITVLLIVGDHWWWALKSKAGFLFLNYKKIRPEWFQDFFITIFLT